MANYIDDMRNAGIDYHQTKALVEKLANPEKYVAAQKIEQLAGPDSPALDRMFRVSNELSDMAQEVLDLHYELIHIEYTRTS